MYEQYAPDELSILNVRKVLERSSWDYGPMRTYGALGLAAQKIERPRNGHPNQFRCTRLENHIDGEEIPRA